MKVKEANLQIEKIDNEIQNLQKLLLLSEEEENELADKIGLNNTIKGIVNTSVNAMTAWKSVLKQRIEDAEI